jgi:hypothetical protein
MLADRSRTDLRLHGPELCSSVHRTKVPTDRPPRIRADCGSRSDCIDLDVHQMRCRGLTASITRQYRCTTTESYDDARSEVFCLVGRTRNSHGKSSRQRPRLAGRAPHGSLVIAILDPWYPPLCSRRVPESNPRCSELGRCPVSSCLPPGEGGDD